MLTLAQGSYISKAQTTGIPETMLCRTLMLMWSFGPLNNHDLARAETRIRVRVAIWLFLYIGGVQFVGVLIKRRPTIWGLC